VLKHGTIDVSAWEEGKDYLHDASFGGTGKTPNPPKDIIFAMLLEMETKPGLKKLSSPTGRDYLLKTAQRLRADNATYLAGEILEDFFQEEMQRAMAEIKPEQIHEIELVHHVRRPKLEEGIKEQLNRQKKEHPSEFAKLYPSGWPTDSEFNMM